MRRRIAGLPLPVRAATVDRTDYVAALALFFVIVPSTLPVILPLALFTIAILLGD